MAKRKSAASNHVTATTDPPDFEGFERWAAGYGVIRHTPRTRARAREMAAALAGHPGDAVDVWDLLHALDRVTSAAMWLVVHETYARNVYLDGRPLQTDDFKRRPEGHTGGSLNMVPAYAGYLGVNALTGVTRAWLMGQGHCVAAVDSLNLLVGNMTPAHAQRYSVTDEGLTRYVRDFYSYALGDDGRQESPLGSHVNAHTAGGILEGGYLGFAELQYVHMPLRGERLVAFLSDGAFEEQRGSDWAPRWWRAEDSGLVAPIMIKNGRRIDQRTTLSQSGGTRWFERHLALNSFDPVVFDGRDPAAFVWAIFEMERRLEAAAEQVRAGARPYPVRLPYGIAVAPKGAGFPGAGTNLAHNLPLMVSPSADARAARRFNGGARRLWVPPAELAESIERLQRHATSGRARERDHPLAHRDVALRESPVPAFGAVDPAMRRDPAAWTRSSPMEAVDRTFVGIVRANPHLRPRVGNPDEMRSNRLIETLEALKFRVTAPERGVPEAIQGAVITALNEEAVACAAVANKGGINLVHTYEAFGSKMFGALRQEVIFADHAEAAGRPQRWLSVPLLLTSHTWENGKNEQSHQDPSMAEAMLGELSHVSRVVFPPDANTAAATLARVYATHGRIWTLVVPKADTIPDLFTAEEAHRLVDDGAAMLDWTGHLPERAELGLVAVGAYQLGEVLAASRRLAERDVAHTVVCVLEPGRFRRPRTDAERAHQARPEVRQTVFPEHIRRRLLATHTRPEALRGILTPLHAPVEAAALGYVSVGGTYDTPGLLFVNRASWAHVVLEAARLLAVDPARLLEPAEHEALEGRRSPEGIIVPARREP
jgi:phosphoketolase